jgi:hypothetical protein
MKIEDKVVVNGNWEGINFDNLKGKIINDSKEKKYLIEFDEYIGGLLFSKGKPGYCWWLPKYMIKKENLIKERIKKFIITKIFNKII